MSTEMSDLTGQPPSARDVDDAIEAVMKILHPSMFTKLPSEIVVNAPNILRILREYKKVAK